MGCFNPSELGAGELLRHREKRLRGMHLLIQFLSVGRRRVEAAPPLLEILEILLREAVIKSRYDVR